jgi:5S rRNA maturation endonuclease (ribonuclease M5)
MKLRGCSEGDLVNVEADLRNANIEYHDPDSKAVASYTYRDEDGKLRKRVQRFIDNETSKKKFVQWRPGANGTRLYDNCPTMLYNLERFVSAGILCITEGEKDADTITRLKLMGASGLPDVVATTSGGAATWQDDFADKLKDKRVIILPDADDEGAKYAAAIAASLQARGIEYRQVDFANEGVKDVSDYLAAGFSIQSLVTKLGEDWILFPDESRAQREDKDFVSEPI